MSYVVADVQVLYEHNEYFPIIKVSQCTMTAFNCSKFSC